MADLHDVPAPMGSRSPSIDSYPNTPNPPTPISPSPDITNGRHADSKKDNSVGSPMNTSADAGPFSPMESAGVSPTPLHVPAPEPSAKISPDAFTPVQKEDVNIFTQAYFVLVNERMEQDRERQRKKEDNAGFVRAINSNDPTGMDEEVREGIGNMDVYVGNTAEWNLRDRSAWAVAAVGS